MSDFPVYRKVSAGYIAIPGDIDLKVAEESAQMVTYPASRSEFSLWNIDNIREYVSRSGGFDERDLAVTPCCPPFVHVWIEWRLSDFDLQVGAGILFDKESGACEIHPFIVERGRGQPIYFGAWLVLRFNSDGTMSMDEKGLAIAGQSGADDRLRPIFIAIFQYAMTAFMFSHCKNVSLEERYPKRHEQREAKRRGEPILKYHEIVIDPHKVQQPSTGANRTDDHPQRALHIARGHFAHYTEDRPLFGKYVGTFWRPAHVRGSAEVGTVKSTYKAKA